MASPVTDQGCTPRLITGPPDTTTRPALPLAFSRHAGTGDRALGS